MSSVDKNSQPSICIILINWNNASDTIDCLRSLTAVTYQNFEIVVVDNGSTDGSVQKIKSNFPDVPLLQTGENLGFVGGNNFVISHPQYQHYDGFLLLNNDTLVSPEFLTILVQSFQRDQEVGIIGPSIYYHDAPETIWSAGGKINWRTGLTTMMNIGEKNFGQMGSEPRQVDFVTGCALLIKRSVVNQIGFLDPRFFAYYEEIEWCVRARRAGFKVLHVPDSAIWHKISLVAREASPIVHYYMVRNRLLFLKLTGAKTSAWISTLVLDYLRTIVSWSVKPKWKYKRESRDVMLLAIKDYFLGKFGQKDLVETGTGK